VQEMAGLITGWSGDVLGAEPRIMPDGGTLQTSANCLSRQLHLVQPSQIGSPMGSARDRYSTAIDWDGDGRTRLPCDRGSAPAQVLLDDHEPDSDNTRQKDA